MEKDKLAITVQIGGFPIHLVVKPEEEAIYRQAQKACDAVYKHYSRNYGTKSVEELWVLTAFQSALSAVRAKMQTSPDSPSLDTMKSLEKTVDELLKLD